MEDSRPILVSDEAELRAAVILKLILRFTSVCKIAG
jgi:hypothetical protein